MTRVLTPGDALLTVSWEPVPQVAVGKPTRDDVRLTLRSARAGSPIRLWLALSPAILARLGWAASDLVCLSIGTGVGTGWLRFRVGPGGVPLRGLGRRTDNPTTLIALLDPGPDLARFEAPGTAAEWHLIAGAQVAELVARIPWDLTGVEAAA